MGATLQEAIVDSGKVDESELEAAKRSLVFELMQREGSMNGAGKQAILDGFRGTNKEYVRSVRSLSFLLCALSLSLSLSLSLLPLHQ